MVSIIRTIGFAIAILTLTHVSDAMAWGSIGHQATGEIAARFLSAGANPKPRLGPRPDLAYLNIADAGAGGRPRRSNASPVLTTSSPDRYGLPIMYVAEKATNASPNLGP